MDIRTRRIAGVAVLAGVLLLELRRLGPGLKQRCRAACAQRMKKGGCHAA